MPLRMRPTKWESEGGVPQQDRPLQYEVIGLPPRVEVLIGLIAGRWQVLHIQNGVVTGRRWIGQYSSAEDALLALARTLV